MKYLLTVVCFVSVFYAFGKESQRMTNASPDAAILDDFKLTGDLTGDQASFSLTATARVENPKGGSLELLVGRIALTEIGFHPKWHLNAESNRFVLIFD